MRRRGGRAIPEVGGFPARTTGYDIPMDNNKSGLGRRIPVLALWLCIVVGLFLPRKLLAEALYLESVGVPSREQARGLQQAAQSAGFEARVVRRFRSGVGWEFVVRVEGFEQRDQAKGAAEDLANAIGSDVCMYVRVGRDVLPLVEISPTAPDDREGAPGTERVAAPVPEQDEQPSMVQDEVPPPALEASSDSHGPTEPAVAEASTSTTTSDSEAYDLLASILRAHGGRIDAVQKLGSNADIHFRYERVIRQRGKTLHVWHDYWQNSSDRRLDVRVLEGPGVDSVALLRKDGGAWLATEGGIHAVDSNSLKEILDTFRPIEVFRLLLQISTMEPGQDVTLKRLESTGRKSVDMVQIQMKEGEPAIVVEADALDHRVRSLRFNSKSGEIRWRFADYHELESGLVLPFKMERIESAEPTETISILELVLGVEADPELFLKESLPGTLQDSAAEQGAGSG